MTDLSTVQPSEPSPEETQGGGFNIVRIVMITAGVLVGLVVILFVLSLLIAHGDVDRLGPIIQVVRDLMLIFLALEGILIVLSLAVLIVQVARLINLLQNEVKPVLRNTQETISTARGTVEFVGDTVARPVIQASAFFAGVSVMARNLFGIRRAMQPRKVSRHEN